MKPAPCSWRVRISLIVVERERLSRKSRFSSPGTPKIYSTPSSSRHWMNRSEALVIRLRSDLRVRPAGSDAKPERKPPNARVALAVSGFSSAVIKPFALCLRLAWDRRSAHSPAYFLTAKRRSGGRMGGRRKIAIGLGAFALLSALFLIISLAPRATAQAAHVSGGTYLGVASCGGTTCHGRNEADGPVVRQDELRLWQDPATAAGAHSRAWAVLRDDRAQEIGRRLGIGDPSTAPICLGCHATPSGPRGLRFQTS